VRVGYPPRAALGERDPIRLRTWALVQAVPPTIAFPSIVTHGSNDKEDAN
jgi:hypothetical protein